MDGANGGLSIEAHGPSTFYLVGEIDLASAVDLDSALAEASTMDGPLVLDVSGVTFMDSVGIRAVMDALDAKPSGCVILHDIQAGPARVFSMTGLDQIPRLHLIPCPEAVAA